jgi:PAS domain S-box-containing protein
MASMKSRLVLFTVVVTAVIWAQTAFNIYERRSSVIHEAERETSTLARTLEVQAINTIASTDLLLRIVIHELQERGWTADPQRFKESDLRSYLQTLRAQLPQLSNLVLIDPEGRFVAQAIGPVPRGISARGREYFRAMLEDPARDKHVSHGFYGRMSKKLIFAVSRRIRDADGKYIGMLVGSIDPNYFNTIYASLDIGREGTIALFDSTGTLIERHPSSTILGHSAAKRLLFTYYVPRSPIGTFISPPHSDGRIRIVGYRKIEGAPMVITVAKSISETLGPWRDEAWREALMAAAITLLLIFGSIVIVRETERRQKSQKSLEESEQRFRNTFDHAPVGIAQLDLEGRWVLTNAALCGILGYAEAELLQRSFISLTHPDDVAHSQAAWHAMISGELDSYCIEKRYVRKDGRPVWVSLTASLHGGRGESPFVLCILSDITSRKATEADLVAKSEQLRQSEETSRKQALILESIIANMADAVIVADENRQFVTFNPAARRLFGEPPAKPFGPEDWVRVFGLYHPDGITPLPPEEVPLDCALQGEAVDLAEIYVRNAAARNGAFVSVSARPMLDERGKIRGAVVVCRDITDARQTSEALRQAQKMEAVGQLTGGIAHDFNNLLQVIMGNSEVLLEMLKSNATHQKLAQMTLTAAQRGAALTSQLLSFSRRQSLQPRPTDVRRLVAETEGLLSGAVGASIEFRQDFAPDLWQVVVDPGMLQSALVNLVLNARDAMPSGGRLTIQAENFVCDRSHGSRYEVRPGDYVRINISDTGIGIPAANLEKVFEPFFTTKEVGKGSGLGLSMVYGFIQQSGGAIRIRSIESYGTVVRLYLPRARGDGAAQPASADNAAPHGSETVLVVEDDPLVRDFVIAALRSLGYTVLAATHGDTALQCLKAYEGPVHLLFTDIVMPGGMTGWELAKRAVILRPALKILFTSGYTEPSGRANADLGPLLAKPYSKVELANAVREALRSGKELVD